MDYQILKDEVTNNPATIPDLDWGKSDKWIVTTLSTPGISNETTIRESIDIADIKTAISSNKDEFMLITQINLARLSFLFSVGTVDPADIQDFIKEIFTVEIFPNIRSALIAFALRPATRFEKLYNRVISEQQGMIAINKARRLL